MKRRRPLADDYPVELEFGSYSEAKRWRKRLHKLGLAADLQRQVTPDGRGIVLIPASQHAEALEAVEMDVLETEAMVWRSFLSPHPNVLVWAVLLSGAIATALAPWLERRFRGRRP
jgi:hypothetical protein